MKDAPPHLKTLEEIERECIPGLVEVLRQEGLEAVRYALWDMTNWHRDYDPCIWRSRATEEQKRVGWEMWVRMEKILAVVLHEAYKQQVEEAMDALTPEERHQVYKMLRLEAITNPDGTLEVTGAFEDSFVVGNQDQGVLFPHDEVDLAAARPVVALDERVPFLCEIPQSQRLAPLADPTPVQPVTPA